MKRSLTISLQTDLISLIRFLFIMSLAMIATQLNAQNSVPTDITINSNSIFENSNYGTEVGAFQTVDSDELDNHSYSLVTGGGDIDNNHFYITSNGSLRSAATFNYEDESSYSIRVRTDDGQGGQFEKVFSIDIEDAAESPTNITLNPNSIAENNTIGDAIGTLTPADEDEGETYTFSFTRTENYPSNSSFEIVNDEVRARESFDFESKDFYVISVEVQDSRGGHYERSISIAINDIASENSSPTDIDLSPRTINEENAIGDVVGTLTTTDTDAGDIHSYSLMEGVVDNDLFLIDDNELKAAAVFDYETRSSYVVQVKTDDGNGGLYVKNLTVLIGNIAESGPPISTFLSNYSIDENNDLYDVVGTFSSIDPDAGDTFNYTLVTGAGDDGNASFRIVGNELQANTTFDYEAATSYTIRVRTTDNQANTIVGNYTISVVDLDDVATLDFKLSSNTINENVANGTMVGTLTPINATVPHQVNFQMVAGDGDIDNALFSRSGRDIHLSAVPDYETKKIYSIRVEADDQGNLAEKILLIHVNDLNEAPTYVNVSTSTIQENNAIGQVVAVLSTEDPDEGDTFTYSFASAEPEFTIDGNQILANETFNFERVPPIAYNVTIRSRDAGFQFSPDRNISFVITNQNENPIDISLSSTSIFENNPAGSIVGTASTNDEDNDDTHTYTVVPGFADADKFEFSENQLQSTELFDYEEQTSYTIRVQVEDEAGAQFVEDFTIAISDAAESPFDINLSHSTINENNESGDLIGVLSAADPDIGDTFTYAVLTSPADGFSFDIANGNELVADEVFDFEDQDSYTINIQVRDQANRSYTEQFTININDEYENDSPSDITLSALNIDESNEIGDLIGTFTTTDANAGDTFTYSFVSEDGGNDNNSFSIPFGTNELQANAIFDYETKSSYDIRVRTDDGNGGSYEESFTIIINDVTENQAPTDISMSETDIDENNDVNDVIGTLSTTDTDEGDTHIYSLVTNPGSSFNILNNQLRASESFDYEAQDSYDIRIESNDQNGGIFEKDFTITINDVNENASPSDIALSASSLDENNEVNEIIGSFSTTDTDEGDVHLYSLVNNPGGSFNILNNQLRASESFDFEAVETYEIRVESNDQNGGVLEKDFTITVVDVNDNPVDIELSSTSIDENNEVNDLIGTLTTTDEDGEDTHTYSLVTNPGGSFNILNNQLRASESFDFEAVETYEIRIETNDQNGGAFEKDFTITVNDLEDNNEPTDIVLSAVSIDENNEIGDLVAILSATDLDAGDSHSYSLTSNPGFYFRIVDDRLEANAYFNFENKDTYDITIRTTDGTDELQKDVTISINDINDIPTSVGLTNTSITENNEIGDLIGIIGTSDQDIDDTHTYSLLINPDDAFAIIDNRLEANTIFDFDSQNSYEIQIRSSDGNGGQLDRNFSITINAEIDEQGPEIVNFTPTTGATGILQTQDLVVTFNEPVALGNGLIKVVRSGGSGHEVISSVANGGDDVISISGSQVTIHLDGDDRKRDLFYGAEYYVNIPSSAILDLAGNTLTTPIMDDQTWTFFAEKEATNLVFDAIADKYVTDVSFDINATTNNIQTSVVYSILSGPANISGNTISLTGETGTVNVQAEQVATQRYKAANVVTSFEVSEEPDTDGPVIITLNPADDAVDLALDGHLIVTFDEPIIPGTADILVRTVNGGSYALSGNATDNPDIFEVSGSTLTINMASANNFGFRNNQTYYVTINSGAVKDVAGNSFMPGITNTTDWNFTTKRLEATWDGFEWSTVSAPTAYYNVIIDGDYSMNTDGFFGAFHLTITSDNTLTVDGNKTLDIKGDLITDGNLIVASGSALLTYEGNYVRSNITIQRNTRYADGKYSFVGTPVEEDANITGAGLGAHVYKYDEGASVDENDLARWQDASLDVLVPGRGYTQANKQLIEFVGKPNDGTITYGGSHSIDGWQLISNPYPAAIHIDDFIDENEEVITGSVYIWDDNGSDVSRGLNSDYIVATKMGATDLHGVDSEARFNDHIGSMQGFFVQLDGFSGQVSFTEEMRVSGQNSDNNFFRKADEVSRLRVNLTNEEGLFRQAMIGWGSAFSDTEFVKGYDAKLFNSGLYQIYSVKEDIPLSIQAVSIEREQIALGLTVEEAGVYSLEIDSREYYGEEIFIHDLIAGRYISAADGPYQFMVNGGQLTKRFELAVKSAVLGVQSDLGEIYASGKTLYIKTIDTKIQDYQVFNLLGAKVLTIQSSGSTQVSLDHLANGVYIISRGQKRKKVILN